ncbi:MAG: hypothetical protein ACRC3Y_07285 [Romboutsia sp.]|uniref:hypothetical protein n=1 Tax=Romboutsia sp. TaxID=1965302 RepID=UPI003F3B6773
MNKYNNSYFLTNIVKKIKNNSKDNINNEIKDLAYFIIKNNNFYNKFESFKNLKIMIENIIDLNTVVFINGINKLNFDELVIVINSLINDIDYETNRYEVVDYNYIEERLVKLVYNTKNIDR